MLVMKALSLGLVKGSIDEVDNKVHLTWVQPRVLDLEQVRLYFHLLIKIPLFIEIHVAKIFMSIGYSVTLSQPRVVGPDRTACSVSVCVYGVTGLILSLAHSLNCLQLTV